MKNKHFVEKEIKVDMSLDQLKKDEAERGNQKRYFRCFINGEDVSRMVG